ncbi:MAG: hypothetical protein M1827_002284 [Pycnora praestabilis]|nr:MAG: hypothetical protein M1827_002284 [Pycnora praestabilis]
MACKYKEYLAATVLNDGHIVSYRSLSKALKVHSNVAKEMLFDFHHQQNSRKPGSIHATYLISGTRTPIPSISTNGTQMRDGDDDYMQSSPFMSSPMPKQDGLQDRMIVTSITMTREEDLEGAKALFENITSIHLYSLEPSSPKDLLILSDSNQEIYSKYATEDPLEAGKQYGTIQNANVKRRPRRRPPPPAVTPSIVTKPVPAPSIKRPDSRDEAPKKESTPVPETTSQTTNKGTTLTRDNTNADAMKSTKIISKTPALRRDSSDIFKSFAKSKSKLKSEDTGSSVSDSPTVSVADPKERTAPIDQRMDDASEDEKEEDLVLAPPNKAEVGDRVSKAEREDKLRKMMDDDDDDDDDDEPMEDSPTAAEEDSQEFRGTENGGSQEVEPSEPPVTVSGGRRRGKRRVMKKKTVKDEEGYLVTREEPVWESFSEDEPKPQKAKTSASTASSTAKAKKAGSKPGQGNIMSFFGKK